METNEPLNENPENNESSQMMEPKDVSVQAMNSLVESNQELNVDQLVSNQNSNTNTTDNRDPPITKCPMSTECPSNWKLVDYDNNSSKDDGSVDSLSDLEMDEISDDVSSEEIDAMLDESLPDEFKKRKLRKIRVTDDVTTTEDANNKDTDPQSYEEKDKIVMVDKGLNRFDLLPPGWLQVTHNSGMPLYLHKTSRVCTLSKPYFLGSGSVRKHKIPVSAVPCLNYRRAMEKEEMLQQKEQAEANAAQNPSTSTANELRLPNGRIETVQENLKTLNPEEFREYCKKLFKFKTIKVRCFKSWPDRREFKKRCHERQLNRPTLPDGTKLITVPIQCVDNDKPGTSKKEWIINPSGKSYVCILHEYMQHALKKHPLYEFKQLEVGTMPYSATVSISDIKYGTGYGSSKKKAKSEAAKSTLEILIPQMRAIAGLTAEQITDYDLPFFDEIKIEDPRVAELCAQATEPTPFAILLVCLRRNFHLNEKHIKCQLNTVKFQQNEFTMIVGKHKATVTCKNKKDGKQLASQAILQALHPHINSWGALLRLYGKHSLESFMEKKQEKQEITQLQTKEAKKSPNYNILNKLRFEMIKLMEKEKSQAKNKLSSSKRRLVYY